MAKIKFVRFVYGVKDGPLKRVEIMYESGRLYRYPAPDSVVPFTALKFVSDNHYNRKEQFDKLDGWEVIYTRKNCEN